MQFTFEFEVLNPLPDGSPPRQTGVCKFSDGETLNLVVNDKKGLRQQTICFGFLRGCVQIRSLSDGCP